MSMTTMKNIEKSLKIALLDDDVVFCKRLSSLLKKHLRHEVVVFFSAQEFLENLKNCFDIVLLDIGLPDIDGLTVLDYIKRISRETEVIIITGYADVDTAVTAIKRGACDYIVKPIPRDRLLLSINSTIEKVVLKKENRYLKGVIEEHKVLEGFVASCPSMAEIIRLIKKIAPLNCNVLIQGETGTGKELVAQAIHNLSKRRDKKFLSINCGGFSEELMANELFGHEKGAFTGASGRKIGLLEAAQGGSVFLDEIGEMALSLQVKLLKVIEEKRIFRLGSTTPVDLDIRIIAATNRDLKAMVKEGTFREDLFFRLNVVTIYLPRLTERREEIPLLISLFINKYNTQFNKKVSHISSRALSYLMKYDFPGNVRELENIIQRAVALCESGEIDTKHLPADITKLQMESVDEDILLSLEEVEKRHIKKVLEFTGYDKKSASAILKLPRTTLWRKIKKYGL